MYSVIRVIYSGFQVKKTNKKQKHNGKIPVALNADQRCPVSLPTCHNKKSVSLEGNQRLVELFMF